MPRRIHEHPSPRRFVAGTVGLPGERAFYLQAQSEHDLTTVLLEKAQVAMLADRIADLLDRVSADEELADPASDDNDPLTVPLEEQFRVGVLALGWEEDRGEVVVEAHALDEEGITAEIGDNDPEASDTLRVSLAPAAARAFVRRARALVAAGRPPCPFCLQPLDPTGHVCPRANGYRRRP